MTKTNATIDSQEISKFSAHAARWWDKNGPLKTLHDINDTRMSFIASNVSLAGKNILDLGCGGGILTESLASAGAKTVGIDASDEAIEAAISHAKLADLAIDYRCALVEEYEGGPYDAITCLEMLEHVSNPELVLSHCARLLQPGGYLFLSTINRTMKAYLSAIIGAEYVLGILPRQTHDYNKFIKPGELTHICRNHGFRLVEMRGLSYNPFSRKSSLTEDVSVNYLMAFQLA